MLNSHLTKNVLKNLLSSFYLIIFPLPPYVQMSSKISLLRFTKNSATNLLNERNHVTVWDELKRNKPVCQKVSFSFLDEDISVFTISFNVLRNIRMQIPRKQCKQTAQCKVQCNSVSWIHTSESSFSDNFLLVFVWG